MSGGHFAVRRGLPLLCTLVLGLLGACGESGDDAPHVRIADFSASPSTIATGATTTLDWTALHAVSCAAEGTLPGWSGDKADSGSEPVVVTPAGSYQARLRCRDAQGREDVAVASVTASDAAPTVTIDSFTATPAEIVAGQSTQLAWSSTGAVACTAGGTLPGWSGGVDPDGTADVAVGTVGTYTATLRCLDLAGNGTLSQLEVEVLASPLACGGSALPPTTPLLIANSGRKLAPIGRMTPVGNFPTGGRLTPDGRYYWSVSAGHGRNDVHVVSVATGEVIQVLPLPGAYGQMVFSADGTKAYVSGEPKGGSVPIGPTRGDAGDVIHVFAVDVLDGTAEEQPEIVLPATDGGSARLEDFPPHPGGGVPQTSELPGFPVGIAITPDGSKLVVALYNADQAAVVDVATRMSTLVPVGAYPYAVAIERSGRFAYVSNAYDGTLSKIDVATAKVVATVSGISGPDTGDRLKPNSHPQYVLADPAKDLLYVAVTNTDGVAIVSTATDSLVQFVSLKRPEGFGTQPVALARSPDGGTLYVANAGENAVVSIALADRPAPGPQQYEIVGKLPTADYASDVQVTSDGCTLLWQAARGAGSGPNPDYGGAQGPRVNNSTSPSISPYPSYVPDLLAGRVGVLPTPSDAGFAQLTPVVDAAMAPLNAQQPPAAGTPLHGAPDGAGGYAPSSQIHYVFYLVRENKSYDQIFGSETRPQPGGARGADGDPSLQVLGDNDEHMPRTGPAGPGSGITPNAHAIARQFVLLDHFYENSEVSLDGHAITAGAYATNYSVKTLHPSYSGRGRPDLDVGVYPVSFPPKQFLFDQAVRQNISFRNYGELSGGAAPEAGDDGRSTYAQVLANSDTVHYPSNIFIGCFPVNNEAPNSPQCAFDAGLGAAPPLAMSRIDAFNEDFTVRSATCTAQTVGTPACLVPRFNYLVMLSNHTQGLKAGGLDPLAMCADNDLGTGQLLQIISSNPAVWAHSVLFVVEDDSQDGADHVDAHRAPALVAGPWVKRLGPDAPAIHTRYDQLSVIRTIELILGMQPLSLFDAVATPMYDVFTMTPDTTAYTAIMPQQDIQALNPASTASAAAQLSAALPYELLDHVPQQINDRILWQRVHGPKSEPPRPGPNASRAEAARAELAWSVWKRWRASPAKARRELREALAGGDGDD